MFSTIAIIGLAWLFISSVINMFKSRKKQNIRVSQNKKQAA